MRKPARPLLIGLVVFFVGLIGAELALRKFLGLGDMTVLFQADSAFEYIAQPNQNKVRFGNKILYNEYSMRSRPLSETDDCIVLGFGDSVINGGTLTDQDSLATTIIENRMSKEIGNGFRFLNISAGSWGPDNCAAYLERFGSFGAKMIVLFVSSHDAYDNMTFDKVVGVDPNYPDKPHSLALIELLQRYLAPKVLGAIEMTGNQQTNALLINKNTEQFNRGFEFFVNYSRSHGIPLVVALHAEANEIKNKTFDDHGKKILSFCAANNIKVVSGLEIGEELSDFRDGIHINESGQKRWASYLYTEIYQTIDACR
jgi:hypothetical protein